MGSRRGRGPGCPDPWLHKLALWTRNVTSLVGQEPELREVERYQLDIVGLTSTHSIVSKTKLLERGWTLFFSGVIQSERRWAGVGILTSPQLSAGVLCLGWHASSVLRGGRGQYLWSGRLGWWFPSLRKGTRGCASVIGVSHLRHGAEKAIVEPWIREEQYGFRPGRGINRPTV